MTREVATMWADILDGTAVLHEGSFHGGFFEVWHVQIELGTPSTRHVKTLTRAKECFREAMPIWHGEWVY